MKTTCPYLIEGRSSSGDCLVAQEIGGLQTPVPTLENSCQKCESSKPPRAPNNITASLAFIAAKAIGEQEASLVKTLVTPYISPQYVDPRTGKPAVKRSSNMDMDCEYAIGTRCLVAERIAGALVTNRTDQACRQCLAATPPAAKNFVTVSLAISSLHRAGDTVRSRNLLNESKSLLRTITRSVGNWREANRRWEAAGKPVRSDEEITEIVAICQGCEHYNAKVQQCRLCGCFCRNKGMARFNKPKMATESCPIGKW